VGLIDGSAENLIDQSRVINGIIDPHCVMIHLNTTLWANHLLVRHVIEPPIALSRSAFLDVPGNSVAIHQAGLPLQAPAEAVRCCSSLVHIVE
jgi:hypothetical protein